MTDPPAPIRGVVTLAEGGGFRIEQPVDVFLVGFPAGTAQRLQGSLEPTDVIGASSDSPVLVPPSPGALSAATKPLPAMPRAVYRVAEVPEAVALELFANVSAEPLSPGIFDANRAETLLAQAIPSATGAAWDPNRPALVILHANGRLPEDHGWRYTYPSGWLEPVRAFGERHPFIAFDVSARPDPYVTENRFTVEGTFFRTVFGDTPVPPYNHPLPPDGDETLEQLALLVVDASHYRLLQPALYPVSTKPCHHVTVLVGVHATSLAEAAGMGRTIDEVLDVASIERALNNLTGGGVTVEPKVLMLPRDDPVLDAFVRTAGNGVIVAFPFLDAMRWWLDQNWDTYVTESAGCEEYLSVTLFGDIATRAQFGGVGTYDVAADRRISFSLWPEINRLQATYEGPGEEVVATGSDSEDEWNTLNVLVAHETGHIFGQHHPQDIVRADGTATKNDAFQSVWSVMSYETNWRVHDFGRLDAANWQRNQAGYAVRGAQQAGLVESPEFAAALDALERFQWADATQALQGVLTDGGTETGARHAGSHRHEEHLAAFRG